MRRGLALVSLALVSLALVAGLASAGAQPKLDYAGVALNVLPPGQSGSLAFPPNSSDQLALYDGLTPLRGAVGPADVRRLFKSARFGPDGRAVQTERPRAGVRLVRDRWGVPHVYGETRTDVAFGAGWATAADRGLLLTLLRGPGRIAALDVPGLDAFALATSARQFLPSEATERALAAQLTLLRRQGPDGVLVARDIEAYVAGINSYNRRTGISITPWTTNDVVAVATLIGAVFGAGGGDEVRASQFRRALESRLGAEQARAVWSDLRQLDDPNATPAVPGRFPYASAWTSERGNALVDDGSFEPWRRPAQVAQRRRMSNALLVARTRSANGHPLFVAGPQVGHLYPQYLMELDLHGGGVDARGAAFPGISFAVLLGRGKDFAWSATSSGSDVVDQVVERLCGDDEHYLHRGQCRAMETFDAGTLVGRDGAPDERIVFRTTVHGPVLGFMDAAWPRLADAVLAPVLGPLVGRLAQLETRHDAPSDGNAFGAGWYSYVEKDLAALLGENVRRPFATRFCGAGDLSACRASLWAALDAAATALEAAQGPDPASWRSSAAAERAAYGFLPRSIRFANRPTFQQVVTFTGHRPRP